MVVKAQDTGATVCRLPRAHRLIRCALAITSLALLLAPLAVRAADLPEIFFSQRVSNNSPFLGQQVLYTLELYSRLPILAPHLHVNLEGVNDYELGQETREEILQGRKYKVTRLRSAFYPQIVGRLDIPPQRLEAGSLVSADPSTKTPQLVETEPVTLVVRPLPPAPSEMEANTVTIVGSTTTLIDFDKSPLQIGQSRKLKVLVRSDGDLGLLTLKLSGTSGLRVYEAPPTLKRETSQDGLMLERIFSYEMVPLTEGIIQITATPFLAFDVHTGTYSANSPVEIQVDAVKGPGSQVAVPVPEIPQKAETRAQIEKERLRYHDPNAMEELLSHLSVSSLLLIAVSLSLLIITVRAHLNSKHAKRAEDFSSLDDLRKAETVADLHRNFREALLTAVAEETEVQGLKQIIRASLSDAEQRIQVEAFLNDLAVEVYSTKDPSAKKFKALKARAVKMLEALPKPG